jgi:hypothetical protein
MTDKKTKDTENQETQKPTNDNMAVFGPLGKYAIVAVIMVSIIVTTAIMLDRQLNSAEKYIAKVENEVTEINNVTDTVAEVNKTEVLATETISEKADASLQTAQIQEVSATDVITTQQKTEDSQTAEVVISSESDSVSPSTSNVLAQNATDMNQQAIEMQTRENQARIEAYKLKQKQHMGEVFSRIKTLESDRLTQYKETQDKQIARLRDQILQQQSMIEALILRNKDLFEMRAANVERNQSQREAILNRI